MAEKPDPPAGTFWHQLPGGDWILCYDKDRIAILGEILEHGSVMLVSDPDPEVYRYVPRDSDEYRERAATARTEA